MADGRSFATPPCMGIMKSFVYVVGAEIRPDENRTSRPSGVHPRATSPAGLQVMRCGSPPSAGITYTALTPARLEVNAIHRPSGEKCGLLSMAGVLVKRRASPPSRGTIHRSAPYSKAICVALIVGWRRSRVGPARVAGDCATVTAGSRRQAAKRRVIMVWRLVQPKVLVCAAAGTGGSLGFH